jgi:hypothetical protein
MTENAMTSPSDSRSSKEQFALNDQSTADPMLKLRRFLLHLAGHDASPYFYADGMPRVTLNRDAAEFVKVLDANAKERADDLDRMERANEVIEQQTAALAKLRASNEPDPVPPKEPTPEWMLKARAEGRAEFLAILLGESAEDFPNDYTGSHSIGCTGDYGVHWEVEKLRASFVVDDATYSYIDTINGNWWSQQHEIETLRDQLERAAQPPPAVHDTGDGLLIGKPEAIERQNALYQAATSFHETYCPTCPDHRCNLGAALAEINRAALTKEADQC